jgi:hypothetical protein
MWRVRVTIVTVETQHSMLRFSTSSHKRHNFRKKFFDHKVCILIPSANLSEMFIVLGSIKQDIINFRRSSCEVSAVPVRF